MAAVYILYSPKLKKYYVGSCLDLKIRLNDHTSKIIADAFTTKANDWELFFSIDGLGYKQARDIESHIKRMKSKNYIMNLKRYSELVEKLIGKYS